MVQKTDPEVVGRIKSLLEIRWSIRKIQGHLKKDGISVSTTTISKIKNGKENVPKTNSVKTRGRPRKVTDNQLAALKSLVENVNPPTQRTIAKKVRMSQQLVHYHIHSTLGKKTWKKPTGHELTENKAETRRRRSLGLYSLLKCDQWRNVITSDEAMFSLDITDGQSPLQYLDRDQSRNDLQVKTHKKNPKSVMVWIAMSANGLSKPRFVPPHTKMNAQLYIKHILRPFFRYDAKKLYPNGNFVFHQDSAPSHTAKVTLSFFEKNRIKFITPQQWMPYSPDVSPCDFYLWGVLKNRLKSCLATNLDELKKAIIREAKAIPLDQIQRAMESWPRRCRQVYEADGYHIEKN